jgi:flagellin-like hook-associated protein FlgL
MDSIPASTQPLNLSEVDLPRPPLPIAARSTKAIEVVFVVDVSGSMLGTIGSLKANIDSFVEDLEATGQPWKVKIVGFSDVTIGEEIESSGWVTNLAAVRAALDSALTLKDGGDGHESLVDGLANAVNPSDWSSGADVIRKIVAFTDAPSKLPEPASGTLDSIAASAVSKGISIDIFGVPEDPVTADFSGKSGATLKPFAASSDMSSVLGDLSSSFYEEDVFVDLQLVTSYLAQNGATQAALHSLVGRAKTNIINLTAAKSRIIDVDVAQESTLLARSRVLLDAGTVMLSQANQSTETILKLLQLN